MAIKRMFSLKVIDTDIFLDMPMSARLLYYDLGMRADDDGFVASPKKILKMIGCSEDDLKILMAKSFIIPFDSGICVIKHWKLNNYIAKDRYTATIYKTEYNSLIDNDGEYVKEMSRECIQIDNKMYTDRQQNDDNLYTQISIDKSSIDKVSKDKISKGRYSAESEEVLSYLNLKSDSNYRLIDSNLKLIDAILKKGYTKEDCLKVIDKKVAEWHGTDMQQYLRPLTIFSNKFDAYLNAPMAKKKTEFEQTQDALTNLYQKYKGEKNDEGRANKNIFDI